jgi:excisionase family DNA binding protein
MKNNTHAAQQSERPRFLAVAEVAELLRLKPRKIYEMVIERRIPYRARCGCHPRAGLPGVGPFEPSMVLLLSAEDGLGDTLRPRLDALGADAFVIPALTDEELEAAAIMEACGKLCEVE